VTIPVRARSPIHLLSDADNSRRDVVWLIELAGQLKAEKREGSEHRRLAGRHLAFASETRSSRTRSAFAMAARDQGAAFSILEPSLTQGLKLDDPAHPGDILATAERSIGQPLDGIAVRVREQASLELIAGDATIPVWNAKTELWHPTHAIADLLTITEHSLTPIADVSLSIVGNARSSVVQSILVTGALLGLDIRVAAPESLQPDDAILEIAERNATAAGDALARPPARIQVTDDLDDAVVGADFLYASPWVHVGDAPRLWHEHTDTMRRFRVDATVVLKTGNSQLKLLHSLPGERDRASALGRAIFTEYALLGADVADGVFRSSRSRVAAQIENRLHAVKAVMVNSFL
jgi:ornithine carbamoyltransferase